MNAQDAKREAYFIVGLLIDAYLDVGQPFSECREGAVLRSNHRRTDDESCKDCDRLNDALIRLRDGMRHRS